MSMRGGVRPAHRGGEQGGAGLGPRDTRPCCCQLLQGVAWAAVHATAGSAICKHTRRALCWFIETPTSWLAVTHLRGHLGMALLVLLVGLLSTRHALAAGRRLLRECVCVCKRRRGREKRGQTRLRGCGDSVRA